MDGNEGGRFSPKLGRKKICFELFASIIILWVWNFENREEKAVLEPICVRLYIFLTKYYFLIFKYNNSIIKE